MIEYQYKINSLTYQGLQQIVESVSLEVHARDSLTGDRGLALQRQLLPAPDPDQFTAFSDLTSEQVLGWVMNQISPGDLARLQAESLENLEGRRQLQQTSRLPWQPVTAMALPPELQVKVDQIISQLDQAAEPQVITAQQQIFIDRVQSYLDHPEQTVADDPQILGLLTGMTFVLDNPQLADTLRIMRSQRPNYNFVSLARSPD